MSKSFEKEYNEMLDSQIPDLWSRIEPKLHDKSSNPVNSEENRITKITDNAETVVSIKAENSDGNVVSIKAENNDGNVVSIKASRKKKSFKKYIPAIVTASVACIAIAIIIPGIINSQLINKSDMMAATSGGEGYSSVADSAQMFESAESIYDEPNDVENEASYEPLENSAPTYTDSCAEEMVDMPSNSESAQEIHWVKICIDEHFSFEVPGYLSDACDYIITEMAMKGDGTELGNTTTDYVDIEMLDGVIYTTVIITDEKNEKVYKLYFNQLLFTEDDVEIIMESIVID